ncbi:Rossmann-like and DUF2520 domain-containing protein [Pandoraea apista]|uniref:Rossmann-like and DUF2520 domain-containing protein n=1 Tax=Pandoraea apista TaxID=93218 RepID=UPI000657C094|nr:DUF2520 domain-containing protein [Pandoraea apista]ALS63732.1 NADP oxidoreductase [Pandoraea apista]RRW98447.1 DUF2520 domain-containing protein [Pandoraea apista]RRX05074.1 DUF2520 domain-containing protein [Pandoraea apista]CFB63270.1 Rossmann-like domain protein [Pandoraea apista]
MTTPITHRQQPTLGFIGAGRVARALATAASSAGYAVSAVASRQIDAAKRIASALPECEALPIHRSEDMNAVFSHADLVFLTVPDDAIATCATYLAPRAGQALVHCSGASEVALLAPATRQGAQIGGFHPLFLFAGLDDDASRMSGSAITIEADAPLNATLHDLANAIGCRALSIPAGERMRYHAGANYAASFLLCLLDEATLLWKAIGMPEDDAHEAMWPLVMGTLNAARNRGLSGALAGPVSRGDARIVARHTEVLASMGGNHATLYSLLTLRAIHLARQRPNADSAALDAIAHTIAPYLPPFPTESDA